ncbi:cytochrome c-type biogenesis protein CcmB [Denitrovibrio acetiphilus DSM 12809]|uniref:Heme exporter protein B n=1 Tax=Denitrovibrio acetiphilus (strain DSM 12809 / NBRC 114555 / N2460) TaxID=522772 RepID=D4H2S0_DENA2|nr:heme exporter protein CcmB [Denitrovibrio acetiphilus]ADD67131.1 cytochrome c-type biogenesis protein CcmB [Denitrovibrio acetiphilus DSM 12809]
MNYMQSLMAIIRKDLLHELKSREIVVSMLLFSVLTVVVFSFIFEPGSEFKNRVVGGILWMAVIFAGLLGLNKSMMSEVNGGNFSALLLAPVDRSAIFFGKAISNFMFMMVVELITIPLFTVLYNISIFNSSYMPMTVFLMGTYGFAILGTLFSIISVNTRTREVMLPLLLLPVMVPVILSAVQALNIYILGEDPALAHKWLSLLAVFDIIFTVVVFAVFDFIVED